MFNKIINNAARVLVVCSCLVMMTPTVQAANLDRFYAGGAVSSLDLFSTGSVTAVNATVGRKLDDLIPGDIGEMLSAEVRVGTGIGSATSSVGFLTYERKLNYFLSALARIDYPLMDQLKVHAVAGVSYIDSTYKFTNTLVPAASLPSQSVTTTSSTVGIGAEYQITKQISAGAEFTNYSGDVSGFSVTGRYAF